jgi:lysozyme
VLYFLVLTFLLAGYPSSVTDGMLTPEEEEVKVRVPMKYNTHGLDLSHHNGQINWGKITSHDSHRSSVRFCFIKATEGTDLIDPRFTSNWSSLKEHKIRRGAYHFFNPATDPRLQALNFILNVKLEEGDFAPVLDWETLGSKRQEAGIVENVKLWLEAIEKHYGIKPIIYTNRYIYREYISKHFKDYPIWISHYEVPELIGYDMNQLYFWQYSMKGKVEGIETHVDFNVFLRDDFEIERIILRKG